MIPDCWLLCEGEYSYKRVIGAITDEQAQTLRDAGMFVEGGTDGDYLMCAEWLLRVPTLGDVSVVEDPPIRRIQWYGFGDGTVNSEHRRTTRRARTVGLPDEKPHEPETIAFESVIEPAHEVSKLGVHCYAYGSDIAAVDEFDRAQLTAWQSDPAAFVARVWRDSTKQIPDTHLPVNAPVLAKLRELGWR